MASFRRIFVWMSPLFLSLWSCEDRSNSASAVYAGSELAPSSRLRRDVGDFKEGICPAWSVLRNCSLSNTCKKDKECPNTKKCCEDACGNHACFEAVLPLKAAEELCPTDRKAESNKNSECLPTKTRFCYRQDCQRCCISERSCNPNPHLLIASRECRRVLCSEISCKMPGEECVLGDYNKPTCICRSLCPRPRVGEEVCGSDGMPYKSECNLNRTSCILARKITVKYHGKCRPNGVRLRVSADHQKFQTVQVDQPGKVTCAFVGKPIMITWQNLAFSRLPRRMVPRKNRLYISRVRAGDSGKYSCKAYDGFSVAEATVQVKVKDSSEGIGAPGGLIQRLDRRLCARLPIPGHCEEHVVRWHFDVTRGVCQPFVYSGCGGNENNFLTKELCQVSCGHAAGDICAFPMLDGPCSVAWPRWYYNTATGRCQEFVYGGCQGNANRFLTKQDCEARCPDVKFGRSKCQRHRKEAKANTDLGVFVPNCKPDGSYEEQQCHGSVCFCIDPRGVEVPGSRVPRHSRSNCKDAMTFLNTPAAPTPCELAHNNRTRFPFGGAHIPQCGQDGSYESVQCSGLTGHCWCVNSHGTALVGTKTKGPVMCPSLGAHLTLCQRQYIDHSRSRSLEDVVPRCKWDGSFEEVQCRGVTCYCVDTKSGTLIPGTEISRALGEPKCTASGGSLTLCQKKNQDGRLDRPRCKEDGRFEEIQCDGPSKACYCVDQEGKQLRGTRTKGPLLCPDLDLPLTSCQREYQRNLRRTWQSFTQFAPGCNPDGSYREVQCVNGACYCVDRRGVEVPGTRIFSAARSPNCRKPDSNLTPCEKKRHAVLLLPTSLHEFIPHCKPDGAWGEIQCHVTSGECWCVDEEGQEIRSTRSKEQVTCPNFARLSPCQKRYFYTLKSSISRRNLPWCKADGSYNEMQCSASYCYCVDEQGDPIPGTKTSMNVGRPSCTGKGGNLTPCQIKYRNAPLMYFLGRPVLRCKQDGSFEEVQCWGTTGCWCVDRDGRELLPGSHTNGPIKCPIMGSRLTLCQQRYMDHLKNPVPARLPPRCNPDGSFAHVQCLELYCFCADKGGNEIMGTRLRISAGKPRCTDAGKNEISLTRCQERNRNLSSRPQSPRSPNCKKDGSFEEVQCSRATNSCWCVDVEGREILGTNTSGYLKCPSDTLQLTPCQKKYQEISRTWAWLGPIPPQCASDGRYEPRQCDATHCFCVNKHGVELEGTRVNRLEAGNLRCELAGQTLTLCQKHFQDFLKRPKPGQYEPRCKQTGDYHELQCNDTVCFCVNRTGHEMVGSRRNITDSNPTCHKQGLVLTACQKSIQEAMKSPPTPGKFIPRCKPDGSYEDVQCDAYTKNCWCAQPDGTIVPGTITRELVKCPGLDVSSPCWKHYQDAVRNEGPRAFVPRCRRDGNYEPLQVQSSFYFCVNERGVMALGSAVRVQNGVPRCRFAVSPGFVQTPCQRWRARLAHLPLLAGRHVPWCTVDGRYNNVQCDDVTRDCWCVSKDGREELDTRKKGMVKCPPGDPLTPCQRHQNEALLLMSRDPLIGHFVPRCKSDGSYEQVQCHGGSGQCWCVEENGNEIRGTSVRGLPNCSLEVKVTACQQHRQRALGLTEKPPPGRYVPTCNEDGSYREIQCQASTALCWCVDKAGIEVLGTRQWGIPTCEKSLSDQTIPFNLAFLLDSSDVVSAHDWQKLLEFTASFLDAFTISKSRTHVGLVVFSTQADVPLHFNTLKGKNLTADGVKEIIFGLKHKMGSTRLDRALLKAEDELFNEANGMRTELPKALVVLTAGRQSANQEPYTPLHAASQGLRDRGVHIYVIGIGGGVDIPELLQVSSSFRDVFSVHEFNTLKSRALVVSEVIRNSTGDLTDGQVCNLAPEPGELGCLASISAWYYNSTAGVCQQFLYSGCGGNANKFSSRDKCVKKCQGVLPACAQERLDSIPGLGHFYPKCRDNGQFEEVQCYGSTGYCWCVDKYGAEVLGTRVMGTPVCSMTGGKTSRCLEERKTALGWFGIPTLGRFVPECKPNGDYADVQCFGTTKYCWCVDKLGREIPRTHQWGTPQCAVSAVRTGVCPQANDTSSCPPRGGAETCALDSDCPIGSRCCECGCSYRCTNVIADNQDERPTCLSELQRASTCPHSRAPGRYVPKCKPDGSYEEVQCDAASGYCWCLDSEGYEIPGSRRERKPNCTFFANMTPCQRDFTRSLAMRRLVPIGIFFPACEADGSFREVQCHAATGYCWCVDRRGNEIVGTRQWGAPNCTANASEPTAHSPVTVCQSKQEECLAEDAPSDRFVPECNEDGSFKQQQCLYHTGECWCVDRYGNEVPGTRSTQKQNCALLAWLSPCQIQRRQAVGLPNVPAVGLFVPECQADGSYEAVQCHKSNCWCVDTSGAEVRGTRTSRRPNCDKNQSCLNERKKALGPSEVAPPGRYVPQCHPKGGYQAQQCHGSTGYCWCVDEYGNELESTRSRQPVNCTASQRLSVCHSRYNNAIQTRSSGQSIPRCTLDGGFEVVQCDVLSEECWCVDRSGAELEGTRIKGRPSCSGEEDIKVDAV